MKHEIAGDYETLVAEKLTETEIYQKVYEEKENNDQKDDKTKFNSKTIFKCGNEKCIDNFEMRCTINTRTIFKNNVSRSN